MEFATPTSPTDVAVGPDGNFYVVHVDAGRASQYSPSGVLLNEFGSFYLAYRIAISPTGAIYIAEQGYDRVSRFQIDLSTAATRTTFGRLKAMYR